MGTSGMPAGFVVLIVAGVAATCGRGDVVVVSNVKEANQLRNKLETAEGRVRELVSKLETVSVDATRAKSEIHETLHEAWSMVDLLSRDKCGDAVEKVRERQRDVELQLHSLQDEVSIRDRQLLMLRREAETLASKGSDAATQLERVLGERDSLQKELAVVRDRLKVSESLFNQSSIYSSLSKSFHTMEQRIDERAELLRKVHTLLGKVSAEHDDISSAFGNLHSLVRQVDAEFQAIASAVHVEGAGGGMTVKRVTDTQAVARLEKDLRDAVAAKNAALKEVGDLYAAVESLKKGASPSVDAAIRRRVASATKSSSPSASAVSNAGSTSLLSIIVALVCGAALTLLLSSFFRNAPASPARGVQAPGRPEAAQGAASTSTLRAGGPMYGSGPSPGGGVASATGKAFFGSDSARGTPVTSAAGGFMDRTPMQYVRSREATPGSYRQ